jgi:hypothetical protein
VALAPRTQRLTRGTGRPGVTLSLCVATTAVALSLAVDAFTLVWTHSVEKTEWQEHWRIEGRALHLQQARVQGSGAGMEPPADAVLEDGWWVYRGRVAPLAALRLAVSGATGRGWQLCTSSGCRDLEAWVHAAGGAAADAIVLSAGPPCERLPLAPARPPAPS